jgi:ABC-2 type transport system ATP-binding protein
VIEAEHLTKRFGGRPAIDDVSLAVARGEVVGFLGPNGAGKTTTMRILAGVFPPTRGRAAIDGCDVAGAPLAARRRVGYAPERPALYLEMTVEAFLAFVAAMKDVPAGLRRRTVDAALERTGLAEERTSRLGVLSKGYRQRVGLALALVGDPPALLLDEPTAGLDPEQSAETRRLIRELGADHAVLVSSHALAEVETLSDRVVILHRGRVLAADRPAALAARLRPTSRLAIEAVAPAAALTEALAAVPGVRRVEQPRDGVGRHDGDGPGVPEVPEVPEVAGRTRVIVEQEPGRDVRPALAATVVARGWGLLALAPVETSLEDAFLALVARHGAD